MAGLNVSDPSRVHAACVGLEYFPRAPGGWALPGAASDALRFACWLRREGVPAENVSLMLSPDPQEEQSLRVKAAGSGLAWSEEISRDRIMDYFTSTVEKLEGDLLYVYWGGHGMLADQNRWVLFCPDASENDPRGIDAADLCSHLTRASLRGLSQQVFLIDACATFLEYHNATYAPALASFPVGPRRHVDQFIWHAAAPGQVAEHDFAERTGVFSKVVLDWLEGNEGGLRPDLDVMAACLRDRFKDAGEYSVPEQTPIRHRIQHFDGSTDQIIPPDVNLVARNEIELELRRLIPNDVKRTHYLTYVYNTYSQDSIQFPRSVANFAQLLLYRPRAMAALVEVLRAENPSTAGSFLALGRRLRLPGLLSPMEYTRLRELLRRMPEISPQRLLDIVGQTLSLATPEWSARIAEFEDSFDRLEFCMAMLEKHLGGFSTAGGANVLVPAVLRFTEYLAAIPDSEPCTGMREWAERVARRLGVDEGGLLERRSDAEGWARKSFAAVEHSPRIVVQLYPEYDDLRAACRFTCVVWTDSGTGTLTQLPGPSAEALTPTQVVLLVQRAAAGIAAFNTQQPVVEIVLRPEHICLSVETWDGADADEQMPMILSVERPMVLRCAPLASKVRESIRRSNLMDRWHERSNGAVVCLRESNGADRTAYGALNQNKMAARTVIYAGQQYRDELVLLALYQGYPVVLWDQQSHPPLRDDHFQSVRPELDADGLPERVRAHRANVCAAPAQYALRPALLWDNPDRPLPEAQALSNPAADEERNSL